MNDYKLLSPVTSVMWHERAVASGDIIVCAEWETARVTVFNTVCKSPTKYIDLGSPGSGLWVMNLMFQEEKILALMSNSTVQTLKTSGIPDPQQKNYDIKVTKKSEIKCMADITQQIPEHKRGLNMVLCGASLGWGVYLDGEPESPILLGDTKGQLTALFNEFSNKSSSLKIHDRDVTSVKVIEDVILTASLDRSVKAWKLNNTRSYTAPQQVLQEGLEQVGQFLCPAPVTSMEIITESSGRQLVCGDQLGNVHFFVLQDLR